MKESNQRGTTWRVTIMVAVLIATLALPNFAAADNTSPDQATSLDAATPSVSDALTGSPSGAYRYYQVAYQGGLAPVTFTLTYQPTYSGSHPPVGFNLYGPSGLSFAGQVTGTSGSSTTLQYTLVNGAAMSILVQVYNYTSGGLVGYTLSVSGLLAGTSTTIVGQNNTTPDQAITPAATSATLNGTIVGSPGGAFQYYNLSSPGGYWPLTVTMNGTRPNASFSPEFGFNLNRLGPNGATTLVATGALIAQDQSTATFSASVSARSAATYQLQVFNYWPAGSTSYSITATGLAGPAPVASLNVDAAHAILLTPAQPGASGTLVGSRGGSFSLFVANYPGNNASSTFALTFQSIGGAAPNGLGFKVYNGANLLATVDATDDGTGVVSASWNYQNASPTTLGIQVFNYEPNVTATWVIYQVGAQ
jgi:hypothetical protein